MTHRSTTTRARFALTGVALATAFLCASNAWALGLGRLSVQSALGETLRAEIEVTSMTAEEAASLRLRIAPAEAYRAAGVDYNPALPSAQVTLQRRPDGRNVVRIVSDRAVLEPFVDVILEATWASGRLVREYTLLFDPPGSRLAQAPAAPAATMPPQMSPAPALPVPPPPEPPSAVLTSPVQAPPAAPAAVPIPPRAAPAPAPTPPLAVRPPAAPAAPAATPPAAAAAPRPSPAAAAGEQVRVRPGDTLSRIATRVQPAGVSLDQMLVSLFRSNPQAFMGENMNRLKSGAVLTVPAGDAAATLPQPQAREIILAQSADFDAYRRALAAGTPVRAETAPARQAAGQVQAQVDDRRPGAAPTPDKLTLSQGGLKPVEAQDARATERRDANARLAELARNVEELKRLQGATAPAASPSAASPAPAPTTPTPAPAPAAAPTVVAAAPGAAPVQPPAAAPTPSAGPTVAAAPPLPAAGPAAGPAPATTPTPTPTAADSEPGFVDDLLQNPLVLPLAGLLVALLAGVGLWRLRKRKKLEGETSFLESRLQPDSFFGASGGQRIDTRDAAPATGTSASSMSYSLSQLDAIGDVDPVAEADVYLAYGRDLQAEEILKEAMRANPDRMAIRIKLLEVYAKRRDSKGFELLATQVYNLTAGQGEDWPKAQALGLGIDPDNALYQPGGRPGDADDDGPPIDALGASTVPYTAPVVPPAFVPAADATLDGDLDLDLDLGGTVTRGGDRAGPDSVPSDFGPDTRPAPPEATQALGTATDLSADAGLDFDLSQAELSGAPATGPGALDASPTRSAFAPPPAAAASADNGLDFDLGDLGDLGAPAVAVPRALPPADVDLTDFPLEDPGVDGPATDEALARKLELAEEFRQIGDLEGARDLLEEVVARADGALRVKAQGMLEQLG